MTKEDAMSGEVICRHCGLDGHDYPLASHAGTECVERLRAKLAEAEKEAGEWKTGKENAEAIAKEQHDRAEAAEKALGEEKEANEKILANWRVRWQSEKSQREKAETRVGALRKALELVEPAMQSLMNELGRKGPATDWALVNDCLLAVAEKRTEKAEMERDDALIEAQAEREGRHRAIDMAFSESLGAVDWKARAEAAEKEAEELDKLYEKLEADLAEGGRRLVAYEKALEEMRTERNQLLRDQRLDRAQIVGLEEVVEKAEARVVDLERKQEDINKTLERLKLDPWPDGRSIRDGKRPWEQHVSMVLSSLAALRDDNKTGDPQ